MKINKKKFLFIFLIIIFVFIIYKLFLSPKDNFRAINMVPENAFLIVETDNPFKTWQELNESIIWQHLQKTTFFNDLNNEIKSVDSLVNNNKLIFRLFGSRKVTISVHHMNKNIYSTLIVADMKNLSKLKLLKNYLTSLSTKNYSISRRVFSGYEIYEIYDLEYKEMMYLSFVENLIVISYDHLLLESSLKQSALPDLSRNFDFIEISNQIQNSGQIRFYLNFYEINKLLKVYQDSQNEFLMQMNFAGLKLDIKDDLFDLTGYLNSFDSISSVINSMYGTGRGENEIPKYIPKRTFLMIHLSIGSFDKLIKNLEDNLKKEGNFDSYEKNKRRIEKLLDINIEENIISWIDDEIGILNLKSKYKYEPSEYVMVIKSKDQDKSLKNLNFLNTQIKKNTPVKFKTINYKGTDINYLSATGLFKVFFGKFFSKLDKPFYMQLNDYVYFSNHPQTLKDIIDDLEEENTLYNWDEYKDFENNNYTHASNLNIFINTPILTQEFKNSSLKMYKREIDKNKSFFDQLPFIGIQVDGEKDIFYTHLSVLYRDTLVNTALNETMYKPELPLIFEQIPNTPLALSTQMLNDSIKETEISDPLKKKYEEFYENDQVKYIIDVVNGIKNGDFVWYYPNGEIKLKGKFENDKKTGTWKYYNEEGSLIEKRKYD